MNKKVLVIYATTSGNSQLVGESICDGLEESGIQIDLKPSEITDPSEMNNYDATIIVASTWNVGLLNDNMIPFHTEMLKERFDSKTIDVVGLGDSKHYDIFCGSADILEKAVKDVGAHQLVHTLRIDGMVYDRLEEFKQWGKIYASKLKAA